MLPVLEKPLLPRHEEPSPTPHLDGHRCLLPGAWGSVPSHRHTGARMLTTTYSPTCHPCSFLSPPPPTSLNLTWMFLPPPHPSLTDTG